jgi:hypothetical protein
MSFLYFNIKCNIIEHIANKPIFIKIEICNISPLPYFQDINIRRYMFDTDIDNYCISVNFIVSGETPQEAMDLLNNAIDDSLLLEQDCIIGIEMTDDIQLLKDNLYENTTEDEYGDEEVDRYTQELF